MHNYKQGDRVMFGGKVYEVERMVGEQNVCCHRIDEDGSRWPYPVYVRASDVTGAQAFLGRLAFSLEVNDA